MRAAASFGLLSALLILSSTASAAVGDNPAPSSEIVAAVSDCAKAVTPGKVDPKAMAEAGWKSGGSGKSKLGSIPVDQYYFGREGGNVVNVVQIAGGISISCVTIAKLTSETQLAEVRAGIASAFAAKPLVDYKGDEAFKAFLMKSAPTDVDKTMIGDRNRFALAVAKLEGQPSIKIVMTPKRAAK